MANYGNSSQMKLDTTHQDLQTVFREVVRVFDNTIVYGNRSPDLQFDLFKQGRAKDETGKWIIIDKSKVVTYCDGTTNKSDHNYSPSRAVDAVPYPVEWTNTDRMYYFAGFVKGVVLKLKAEERITHDIGWGGDWDNDMEVHDQTFMDLAHFYIIT